MASDDPLDQALEELKKPAEFSAVYDSTSQRYDGLTGPLVKALRLAIAEIQSLRDEMEELRRGRQ
jgi:hypothetical protein